MAQVTGKEVSEELLNHLQKLPLLLYPPGQLLKRKVTPESEYQLLVKVISETVHRYLRSQKHDRRVMERLQSKWTEQEITAMMAASYAMDLLSAKTLMRCFDDRKASRTTIDILNAYYTIVEIETARKEETRKHLWRISGLYYQYVLHTSTEKKIQESIYKITSDGKAATRYVNIDYELVETKFDVELVGTTGLLLTSKEEKKILFFYIYTGAIHNPSFLQGVFMYANRDGNTVANLAVFQRAQLKDKQGNLIEHHEEYPEILEREYCNYKPSREQEKLSESEALIPQVTGVSDLNIRKNIQYFLHRHARPLTTLLDSKVPFDFSIKAAPYPGSYQSEAQFYTHYRKFIGRYSLYFSERFSSISKLTTISSRNPENTSIGIGVMKIEEHEVTGELVVYLSIKRNQEDFSPLNYRGRIINDKLTNNSYLIISLYNKPNNDRYLNFLFNIIDDNKLIGAHNTAYSPPGQIGSGLVIALRTQTIQEPSNKKRIIEDQSMSVDPMLFSARSDMESKVLNYLSLRERSLVPVPDYIALRDSKKNIYQGTYKVYYARSKGGLKVSSLVIYPNGSVTYRDFRENHAFGRTEQSGSTMLTITLKDEKNEQKGFCCIRVDAIPPQIKNREDLILYSGSFAGFSRMGNRAPLSSLFIMEFVSSDTNEEQLISLPYVAEEESTEYKEIPKEIRFLLTQGRSMLYQQQPVFCLADIRRMM